MDETVLVLLDHQDHEDFALGLPDERSPATLLVTALVVVLVAALVGFILRCLSLSTWRRSRQSLDAPGVQTIARVNISAEPADTERAGGDGEGAPECLEAVTVAADWYPDPRGVSRLRYWDGQEWTDHIAD